MDKKTDVDGHRSRDTNEVLEILMGSGLYFELPLHERQMLLKHVMEAYHQYQASKGVH